ncbi:MAG: TetR/AcrR family transcriptional regulator [Pseudomonadota bacterium]
MSRQPKAKLLVLETAQKLVAEQGTGALTFEALSKASGVTRGGITYHFPTKDALLKALIAHDMQQWMEAEQAFAPDGVCDQTSALIADIRSYTTSTPEYRRFVSGMVGAAMLEPDLLDPVRKFHCERFDQLDWSEADIRRMLLRLAAEGLFWMETFNCYDMPAEARKRLVLKIEMMAKTWADEPEKNNS